MGHTQSLSQDQFSLDTQGHKQEISVYCKKTPEICAKLWHTLVKTEDAREVKTEVHIWPAQSLYKQNKWGSLFFFSDSEDPSVKNLTCF